MAIYEKSGTLKFLPFMAFQERERRQAEALVQIEAYLESCNGQVSQRAKDKIRALCQEGMGQSLRSN